MHAPAPTERRCTYGESAYCSFLRADHAEVAAAAESRPSLLKLVERWLERTPFLEVRGDGAVPGGGMPGGVDACPLGGKGNTVRFATRDSRG